MDHKVKSLNQPGGGSGGPVSNPECEHLHWVGIGQSAIKISKGILIVYTIMCERCRIIRSGNYLVPTDEKGNVITKEPEAEEGKVVK